MILLRYKTNQSMSGSDWSEEEDGMDDKLQDDLTLGKVQDEIWKKKTLVKKGGQLVMVSQKKGRTEGNGSRA